MLFRSTDIYLRSGDNASDIKSGHIILTYVSSNTWVVSGLFKSGTAYFSSLAGSISLSATLDRVRLTTSNGTDTFDNGSANVMYE